MLIEQYSRVNTNVEQTVKSEVMLLAQLASVFMDQCWNTWEWEGEQVHF